jgi:antitoxin component YwqK of YwqJK toxin-antitoxin module
MREIVYPTAKIQFLGTRLSNFFGSSELGYRISRWTMLCALTIALTGCSRTTAPLPEVNRAELKLSAGRLVRQGQAVPFSGVMVERYPDGSLMSRSVVEDGHLNGLSEGWYQGGQIQVRESFKAGVADGVRTKWRPDGTRLSEAVIVGGKLEGLFRRWHENGVLAEEIPMKQDKPDGLARAYYPSGCLKTEARFSEGVAADRKTWRDGERRSQLAVAAR